MVLVAPQRGRRLLDRQRHLAAAIAAQPREAGDQLGIAGDKAGAQPGRARPLGERMEDEDVGRARRRARRRLRARRPAPPCRRSRHSIRRARGRNRIAAPARCAASDSRGWRRRPAGWPARQVEQRGALQRRRAGSPRGRAGSRFSRWRRERPPRPRHRRRAVIAEIVRVGHQHDRPPPRLAPRHHEAGEQEKPLLGAGERQDVALGR